MLLCKCRQNSLLRRAVGRAAVMCCVMCAALMWTCGGRDGGEERKSRGMEEEEAEI